MRMSQISVAVMIVIVLAASLFTGCVSQSDYDSLLSEKAAAETAKAAAETERDNLLTEKTTLLTEKITLETETQNLEAQVNQLNEDLSTAQTSLADLQDDYASLNTELSSIKEVFPPKEFSIRRDLENWLDDNDISERPDTTFAEDTMALAYELQEAALNDGYIISVDYDKYEDLSFIVVCSACINGKVYYWSPKEDTVYPEPDFDDIER